MADLTAADMDAAVAHHRRQRAQHGSGDGDLTMAKISKRYKAMAAKVAPGKSYGVDEALKILKENAKTKFVSR